MKNKLITITLINLVAFLIIPVVVFAEENGTVFLPEDCSTYGIWDELTSICTLTQDLTESVEITTSNITLDCNNHIITGNQTGTGISLTFINEATIKRCIIENFLVGIGITEIYPGGTNNIITENKIRNNIYGISFTGSSDNNIYSNEIANNQEVGIWLEASSDNTISQNNITDNELGILFNTASNNNVVYHNNFLNNLSQAEISNSVNNLFDNGYPSGGNYWSDYVGVDLYSGPNQDQFGSDGIGDAPYVFYGGQDRYPFMEESGWAVPVNQPPTLSTLNQYKSDGILTIDEEWIIIEPTVVLKAVVNDPDNDQVKLQIELKEFSQPFDETDLIESDFVPSSQEAAVTRYGLVDGQYHWRARAMDSRGATSDWQEFGEAGNVDFEIRLVSLYTQIESQYPPRLPEDEWANLQYGNGNYPECFSEILNRSTIATCGCAITSEVMILRFHGVTTTVDNKDVNPGTFNEWLTNNSGYWSDGGVKWEKIQEYSRNEYGFARVIYDGPITFKDNLTLDLYLDNLKPVILYERALVQGVPTSHFIVADGQLAATYTVKDPAWYETRYLTQVAGPYIQNYNNYFYGLRLFSPALALRGVDSISLNLASPAELLVTDPQ